MQRCRDAEMQRCRTKQEEEVQVQQSRCRGAKEVQRYRRRVRYRSGNAEVKRCRVRE